MHHRKITSTPVELTELGFGASVIGNLYRVTPVEDANAAIETAWDAGIRYFDTAPHYGLGLSERRLGAALREYPRAEYVVSSKVGRLLVPNERPRGVDSEGFVVRDDLRRRWDFSRDGVLRSIEATLTRTGLDRLDVVYLHDPDDHWQQAADEAMPALADLRDQGVVGAIGAGMNQSAMLARFLRETPADVVMLAGRYTLLDQSALDDVLPAAREHHKSVVAVGVFNSGLLSRDRPAEGMKYDYRAAPAALVDRARAIAEVCAAHGTALPVAAIAFPLTHPTIINVTLGMRTAEQVGRNVELHQREVPDGLWDDLRAQGLIRSDVPGMGGRARSSQCL
ncbi:aldo/keto reductase [Streptomyces stelliscabiei]|uniref:aldo/keto reductase n=1 Tax=Streptomyces stelliscabiei TaxID=146820 RepID=UPI0029A4483B|nr:aldo/keto reductase [Streptomyces stelliscabiei]MDX2550353.1 aldo/keto reductase [Streptomyces stelliscabiei]MDX2610051.1 aldo/keto reductase [Streptomyces stelliscabiei]MDX2635027.1 aldo/keto reductase [Streptomyces stelliscabiei]MDX2659973.1 aldo/keto reductase [Streptomyces stelliscabiei]MDX2711333.1 aldo/keto reductase [Streptomyces stelliscabiei]